MNPVLPRFIGGRLTAKTHMPHKVLNSDWEPACSREGILPQIQE